MTSTLPATLTTALAGQGATPDLDTGLVYLGAGRWYDPALGRPLQPYPLGGPPTLPQALNRYAPTPWGAPGVVQAQVGHKPGVIEKGLFKTVLSTITGPDRQRTINAAVQSLLASSIDRSRATGMAFVQVMGESGAFTGALATLRLFRSDTYPLPP